MGYRFSAANDFDSKAQYTSTSEAAGSITCPAGTLNLWVGTNLLSRSLQISKSGLHCIQALREADWPNPGAGLINYAMYSTVDELLTIELDAAAPPVADEDSVVLLQGEDFTFSHDSNSAHGRRLIESAKEFIVPPSPFQEGMFLGGRALAAGDVSFKGTGTYNIDVDWGDGPVNHSGTGAFEIVHTVEAGAFGCVITGSVDGGNLDFSGFSGDPLVVEEWGVLQWDSLDTPGTFSMNPVRWVNYSSFNSINPGYLGFGIPFDMATATSLESAFMGVNLFSNLTSIDFTGWDVSGVTTMRSMFNQSGRPGHSGVTIDVTGWNTALVTDCYTMFSQASAVPIGIETWDLSACTTCYGMFSPGAFGTNYWDENTNLDLSGWGLTNCRVATMFQADQINNNMQMGTVILGTMNVNDFEDFAVNTSFVSLSGALTGAPTLGDNAFDGTNTGSGSVDLSGLDISGCGIERIFRGSAGAFDVTGWVLPSSSQPGIFQNATATFTGVDTWNVTAVAAMASWFNGYAGNDIDFSGWDLSAAVAAGTSAFGSMFLNASGILALGADSFVEACYNARLSSNATSVVLDLTTIGGQLSGVYQDNVTPTTGLEFAFKLNNNPDLEAFTAWTITGTGIT